MQRVLVVPWSMATTYSADWANCSPPPLSSRHFDGKPHHGLPAGWTIARLAPTALALPPVTLLHRACGRRGQAPHVRQRTSAGVPPQGAAMSGRLRDDARAVVFRLLPTAHRHGNRVQPR